jgi:hypothetical protein
MTPLEISEAVTTYFLAAPLDDDRLAAATWTTDSDPGDELDDNQARALTDSLARICLDEAGIGADSPYRDTLARAAVLAVVDGEYTPLPALPGIVWGHERQAAIARATTLTSKLVSARLQHRAALRLRSKLQSERCQDAGMLGTTVNAAQRATRDEQKGVRHLLAALQSLDAEELQAGLDRVSRPNPHLTREEDQEAHLSAAKLWQVVLEEAEADPQRAGGPTDRTAIMRLLQNEVTDLESELAAARGRRDDVIRASTGTTNYRVARGTGLSKPAVAKIRPNTGGDDRRPDLNSAPAGPPPA